MASAKRALSYTLISTINITAVLLQLHALLLVELINQRRKHQALLSQLLIKKRIIQRFQNFRRKKQNKRRSCWYKRGRTDSWWQNIITGVTPDEFWKKNFRLNKHSFFELLNILEPYISPDPKSPNTRALPADKKLAVALYYLKDSGSLNMTANAFGIAINTTSAVVSEICNAIVVYAGPKYLHLPRTETEMRKKVSEFEAKFGMIQAFGCIDGTHIPIACPTEHSHDFYCYKQFYSLNVQGVCDYRGYFMDIECMWPGCVHDAKVFANSSINNLIRLGKLPQTYQNIGKSNIKIPNYLIADPAYPLLPHCMKEYSTCKTNEEVIFNNMLRSARNPIECAYGRLKARWQILTKKIDIQLEKIPTLIHACFVLHNFCERHNQFVDEEQVKVQMEISKRNENKNIPDPIFSCSDGEGEVIRKVLTDYILDINVE